MIVDQNLMRLLFKIFGGFFSNLSMFLFENKKYYILLAYVGASWSFY